MSTVLDARLLEALADARLSAADRDRVVDLCESVVATVTAMDLSHPGRATRSAVVLALDLGVPGVDARTRLVLARLCERAVVQER